MTEIFNDAVHVCIFADCDAKFNTIEGLEFHLQRVHGLTMCHAGNSLSEQIQSLNHDRMLTWSMVDQINVMLDKQAWYGGVPDIT